MKKHTVKPNMLVQSTKTKTLGLSTMQGLRRVVFLTIVHDGWASKGELVRKCLLHAGKARNTPSKSSTLRLIM